MDKREGVSPERPTELPSVPPPPPPPRGYARDQRIAELEAEVARLRAERDKMRRAILDQLVSAEIRDALYDVGPPPEWKPKG